MIVEILCIKEYWNTQGGSRNKENRPTVKTHPNIKTKILFQYKRKKKLDLGSLIENTRSNEQSIVSSSSNTTHFLRKYISSQGFPQGNFDILVPQTTDQWV